ncbi:unnamed protein product [Discosporangium mesarthrocarpum]
MSTMVKIISVFLTVSSTSAFVTHAPAGSRSASALSSLSAGLPALASRNNALPICSRSLARPAARPVSMVSDAVKVEASRLREAAAAVREESLKLERKAAEERRQRAERAFNMFDKNGDGHVDLAELQEGLEGSLRYEFIKILTKRFNRRPTTEEVNRRIAVLPGGVLRPEETWQKLLASYDTNGDGVLQLCEFAPAEELRYRLEAIYAQQQELEREARVASREQVEAKTQRNSVREMGREGLALTDANDGPPTAADKALSALPYLLPVMDLLSYAGHLFTAYPDQFAWAQPLVVLLSIYRAIPFSGFASFLGISLAANNPTVNKLVRFNLRQAINLDIALLLPGIVGALSTLAAGDDAARLEPLGQISSDLVVLVGLAAMAYSVGSSALGIFPNKIPIIGAINRENPDKEGGDMDA